MSANTVSPLILRLFGSFQALCAGQLLPPLRSQKGKWLLALLTLERGREMQRAWLADQLWPDSDKAQDSLNTTLSDLRKAMGDQAERIQSGRRTLRLDLDEADVDVFAYEAALAARSADALRRAIDLYTGPLLADCYEIWALPYRDRYAEGYLAALETLATQALTDGERDTAVAYLRRAVVVDQTPEKTHARLMQLLAETHDYTGALQVYTDLQRRLQQDFGRSPEPETTALYDDIRQAAHRRATRSAPTPPAARGVAAPPPPAEADSNLPHPFTALLGRDADLKAVTARLSASRLVTLTGPGGVGKTRLATEAALQLAAHYPHGAHLVALDAVADPALIAQQVASTVGAEAGGGRDWQGTLLEYLRPRRALIVLDNCEHLLAACAELVRAMLNRCPGVRVLATSRERLGLTGEQTWPLAPLALPASEGALALRSCLDSPAIQLFCERAEAIRPAFALSMQNAEDVVEICRRLDGLPLALELAAPLLETLTVSDIAAHLEDRFPLLSAGDRTAPPRHRGLDAALDWSYERLTAAEKGLLCRLSIFAGAWTLAAAQALLPEGERRFRTRELLSQLAAKSLIVVAVDRPEPRYNMLETIRAYGRERLRAPDGDPDLWRQTCLAHCRHYLALATEAEPRLTGADQAAWLERLTLEYDNIRAALSWATGGENDAPEMALELAAALVRFWYSRGYLEEGCRWLEAALRTGQSASATLRLKAAQGLGSLCYARDDNQAARTHFETCLSLARSLGDRRAQASALASLGNVDVDEGRHASARQRFEAALQLFQELEDRRGTALTLSNLATLLSGEGDFTAARALHERGLALFRQLGALHNIAHEANNFAHTLLNLGEIDQVRPYLEESLDLSAQLDSPPILAHCLTNYRALAALAGDWQRAAVLLGAEAALREQIDLPLPTAGAAACCRDEERIRMHLDEMEFEASKLRGRTMTVAQMRRFACNRSLA
jgi:predicted ATPase/DNA-binding SARP family transcriptional activator